GARGIPLPAPTVVDRVISCGMFTQIPRTTASSQSRTLTTRGRGGGAAAGDPYVPGLAVPRRAIPTCRARRVSHGSGPPPVTPALKIFAGAVAPGPGTTLYPNASHHNVARRFPWC